jgi:hypothetical protein
MPEMPAAPDRVSRGGRRLEIDVPWREHRETKLDEFKWNV